MAANLQPIRDALTAGDKKKAQELLRPLLRQPTPELWVLASKACATREQAIDCLRRALALDPYHTDANRLLLKLEGARPGGIPEPVKVQINEKDLLPLKKVKRKPVNWTRRIMILLGVFLLGSSCSLLTLNMIGVVSGPIGLVIQVTGGPKPVTEVEGVPLAQAGDDAVMAVAAAQSEPAQVRDTDVLDNGYLHEYKFDGVEGDTALIYVQFLSLTANRVSRNVAVVAPGGRNIADDCARDRILQGDNNVTFTCELPRTGEYVIRILGRTNESVGAYFVGVERYDMSE